MAVALSDTAPKFCVRSRLVSVAVLAFAAAGLLTGWVHAPKVNKDAESLAQGIIAHIRETLPGTASLDDVLSVARRFAVIVTEESIYPVDVPKLTAAANDSIDKAAGSAATANSLLRAAIAGALATLTDADRTPCQACGSTSHAARPTSTQVGTLRVVTFPTLYLEEGLAYGMQSCSALNHYLDFPTDGVTGVVLDLRGNQGGPLRTSLCLAAQFVAPGTPLLILNDRSRAETVKAEKAGSKRPIGQPLVVLIDANTESGALALAAALRDAGRASLIGESKQKANGSLLTPVVLTRDPEGITFTLPVGYISRLGGARLADGLQVDVEVPTNDDQRLLEAARVRLEDRATQ